PRGRGFGCAGGGDRALRPPLRGVIAGRGAVRLGPRAQPHRRLCGGGPARARKGGWGGGAVLALPAVGGKFGVRGGGYVLSNSGAYAFDRAAAVGEPEPRPRVINMNRLGEVLLERNDPPFTVLFSYNCNPLATMPNQEKV